MLWYSCSHRRPSGPEFHNRWSSCPSEKYRFIIGLSKAAHAPVAPAPAAAHTPTPAAPAPPAHAPAPASPAASAPAPPAHAPAPAAHAASAPAPAPAAHAASVPAPPAHAPTPAAPAASASPAPTPAAPPLLLLLKREAECEAWAEREAERLNPELLSLATLSNGARRAFYQCSAAAQTYAHCPVIVPLPFSLAEKVECITALRAIEQHRNSAVKRTSRYVNVYMNEVISKSAINTHNYRIHNIKAWAR